MESESNNQKLDSGALDDKVLGSSTSTQPSDGALSFDLQNLASEERWSELSVRCEELIALHGEKSDFRLLWIKAQCNLKSIPAEFLAAPLDSVTRDLSTSNFDSSLKALASGVLRQVANLLDSGGELGLPVTFYFRAFLLDGLERERLRTLIADERASLLKSKNFKRELQVKERLKVLEELEKEINNLQITAPSQIVPTPESEPSPISSPIVESVAPTLSSDSVTPKATVKEEPTFGVVNGTPPRKSPFLVTILGTLVICGVIWILRSQNLQEASDAEWAKPPLFPKNSEPTMVIPEAERKGRSSQLDAIMFQIDADVAAKPQQKEVLPQEVPPPARDSSFSMPKEVRPAEAKPKEVVDTTGPIEPKLPPPAQIEDHNSDKLFGGPKVEFGTKPTPSARSEYTDRRYEKFNFPRDYRVVGHTRVRDIPSFGGRVVASLEADDQIRVVGREGDWLELQPKRRDGRPGYIIAQDAIEQ